MKVTEIRLYDTLEARRALGGFCIHLRVYTNSLGDDIISFDVPTSKKHYFIDYLTSQGIDVMN